jgi:hypothetical protein
MTAEKNIGRIECLGLDEGADAEDFVGTEGRDGGFWDDDGVDGFTEGVEDFEEVAFFAVLGVGDDVDEGADVAGFEVMFGEVLGEGDLAVEFNHDGYLLGLRVTNWIMPSAARSNQMVTTVRLSVGPMRMPSTL